MAAENPTPETTTRDVLHHIDRRLTLIESDVRELGSRLIELFAALEAKIESRFAAFEAKMDNRFAAQDAKMESRFAAQDQKINETSQNLHARMDRQEQRADTRFRWTIGLMLVMWMSTMGTILFRLGPLPQ